MSVKEQGQEPDDFERRLSRMPLKTPPADWRAEILDAAMKAREAAELAPTKPRPKADASNRSWLEAILRLPLGWAALAAVWAFALSAGNVDRWLNGGSARALVRVSAAQFAQARMERDALGGLNEAGFEFRESLPARSPHEGSPRPRSDRRRRGPTDPFEAWLNRLERSWLS
jgi:hypothetical protein